MSPGGQPRRKALRCFRKLGNPDGATRGDAGILCAHSLPTKDPWRAAWDRACKLVKNRELQLPTSRSGTFVA